MLKAVEFVKNLSPEVKLLLLLLVPVAAIMLLHYFVTGFIVYNDGIGYYVYGRSFVIDKDLDFTNEWAYYNTSYSKFSSVPRGINAPRTKTPKGYPENIYLIGNSLMWLPFILTAHATAIILSFLGLPVNADGYSWPYEIAIGFATLIYGFFAMLLIYKFCRKWFDKSTSLLATIGVWYGTSAFWYNAAEPSMAHINSIFLGAAFTLFWHNTLGKRTKLQWLLLGMLLGLIYLVRQQDILLGLLPGFELLRKVLQNFRSFTEMKKAAAEGSAMAAGLLVNLFPQILVWKNLYGSYLVYSHAAISKTDQLARWTFPQIVPFIFSAESGMWRIPLMPLSIVGVFLFAKKVKGAVWCIFAVMIIELIAVSSWGGWVSGYGIRLLLGMSAFFALGTAEIIERLKKRMNMRFIYALAAALIALNFLNMFLVMMKQVTTISPITEIPRILLHLIK